MACPDHLSLGEGIMLAAMWAALGLTGFAIFWRRR